MAELITDKCSAEFCRINTLLDLMACDVAKRNNSDFNVIEALLPAVRSELDSLWNALEAQASEEKV